MLSFLTGRYSSSPESQFDYDIKQTDSRPFEDFLKELGLTEGRATGIPTIQKHLKLNGNAPAIIETDDDRTYFLMTIPCHPGFSDLTSEQWEEYSPVNSRLEQILGQSFVKVQEYIYQSVIGNKEELLQILEQLSVKVWSKAKKAIDMESFSLMVIDMIEYLKVKTSTIKELMEFLKFTDTPEFRRKILLPLISLGYVEMTDPDKPTSSKQKYRLSNNGINLFYV